MLLSACIGHGPRLTEEDVQARARPRLSQIYLGRTRGDILFYYGAPSRKITIDRGLTSLEYASRARVMSTEGIRRWDRCTTRFLFDNGRVVMVDTIGNLNACLHFLKTRRRRDDIYRPLQEYP